MYYSLSNTVYQWVLSSMSSCNACNVQKWLSNCWVQLSQPVRQSPIGAVPEYLQSWASIAGWFFLYLMHGQTVVQIGVFWVRLVLVKCEPKFCGFQFCTAFVPLLILILDVQVHWYIFQLSFSQAPTCNTTPQVLQIMFQTYFYWLSHCLTLVTIFMLFQHCYCLTVNTTCHCIAGDEPLSRSWPTR